MLNWDTTWSKIASNEVSKANELGTRQFLVITPTKEMVSSPNWLYESTGVVLSSCPSWPTVISQV